MVDHQPSERADLVRNIAANIKSELLWRLTDPSPAMREAVEATAQIAAAVCALDADLRKFGGPAAHVQQHCRTTETLMTGLFLLGTDKVSGTVAEQILTAAMQTRLILLDQSPVAGSA